MHDTILLDAPLTPFEIALVAQGADLMLSDRAIARIKASREIVEAIVEKGIRGYGINTGVGALCDVIIGPKDQSISRAGSFQASPRSLGPS